MEPDRDKKWCAALAVGLIDHTFERVGNSESADNGHFGVTGWKVKHVSFSKGTAVIRYVGKSGVKHEKVVDDALLVRALRKAVKNKKPEDEVCGGVSSRDVNAYLKPFDVTAKDIRGLHANREMQDRLREARKKGGKLPTDKKEKEKVLKAEFKSALEATAEAVGHEAATLRSQYLVPGLEDDFMKDGTVADTLKNATIVERVASAYLQRQATDMMREASTTYVPLLIPADHPRGQKIPMPRKPDDVWIWGPGVPTKASRPVYHRNAVRADVGHDWHWGGGQFRYSGTGDPGDVWLLLQYGSGTDTITCPKCGAAAPESAQFCPGCGKSTEGWDRKANANIDPDTMTVQDLQAVLRGANLATSGSRSVLVKRLTALLDVQAEFRGKSKDEIAAESTVSQLQGHLKAMGVGGSFAKSHLVTMLRNLANREIAPRAPTKKVPVTYHILWENPVTGRTESIGLAHSSSEAERLRDTIERRLQPVIRNVQKHMRVGDLRVWVGGDAPIADDDVLTTLHEISNLEERGMGPALSGDQRRLQEQTKQIQELAKRLGIRVATLSEAEKEDREVERLSRKPPQKKPPRKDSQRNRIDTSDKEERDPDLSMNYKDIGG